MIRFSEYYRRKRERERLTELEERAENLCHDTDLMGLLRAHTGFLDYLNTRDSSTPLTDYREAFTIYYLTHGKTFRTKRKG